MHAVLRTLVLSALLAAPAFADLKLVRKSHSDPYTAFGKEVAAKDSQSTVWMAKDRLRIESEGMNAIVRLDQKKLILLNAKDKSWMSIDLPFDLKQYVPPERAALVDQIMGARALQARVEAKDESKTIGAWKAKRYDVALSQAGRNVTSEVLWATQDIAFDSAAYVEMYAAMMSLAPENKNLVVELKKVQGVPVRSEKTQFLNNAEVKTVEELVSAAEEKPPEGLYDPPEGYTQKPFEPMKGTLPGGPRPAGGGEKSAGGGAGRAGGG